MNSLNAIEILSIKLKSDLYDKIKEEFIYAVAKSLLSYGCTTWTQTKGIEKNLDENSKRMLRTILKKSWDQHLTKQRLYGYLHPISRTTQIWHVGHYWRSKHWQIRDVLWWTPAQRHASVDRLTKTYFDQFYANKRCSLDDLLGELNNWDSWQVIIRELYAVLWTFGRWSWILFHLIV